MIDSITNVCPRCRSKDIEESLIQLTAKCKLCGWNGPIADCLAVTQDGMIIEKVMERMVHRLTRYVGTSLAQGIVDFCREYGIRIRPADLQRVAVKIVTMTLRTLMDELMALAPKSLQEKVSATNTLLAGPSADPIPIMPFKEFEDDVIRGE